jgi:hypothetical protein
MFRTNVSRGVTFTAVVLIVVLTAIAYGWVGSGQFTWKQVAQIYGAVLLILSTFGAGIWWVSRGEGWDD